jgi:UDP-2,3-diacylglucosamine pyrophosphatase LpxH
MPHTVIVISDLHIGGAPGFRICSDAGRTLLADFLATVADQARGGQDVHLVVNGDVVDFLAEEPFEVFTADNRAATAKLRSILESSAQVWAQFRAVAAAGAEVTLLLGNHDLELTLPGPNRLLRETLGPGRVNLLFDNQALDLGDVLIEHGNRYDAWNIVNHDALRRARSAASRRESIEQFPAPAGSKLVIDVMNDIKGQLRFVDLLKPENDAVLPLLAALSPVSAAQIKSVIAYQKQMRGVRFDPQQRPLDRANISNSVGDTIADVDEPGAALANALLATDTGGANIGFDENMDFLHLWRAAGNASRRGELLDRLYIALRHRVAAQQEAFRVDRELPEYETAAKASAGRGFKLVVYGHTHLVKRVSLAATKATYINTGTWADLMMVPHAVLVDDRTQAIPALLAFVSDLEHNRLDRWRHPVPTFARIEMEGTRLLNADVLKYSGSGRSEPVPVEMFEPIGLDVRPAEGV